ncbi:MAG: ribose-5-phosphate isomerase RpiA [Thermoplasmata archaeon]
MNTETEKKNSAYSALSYVKDGDVVGLGTGTTVKFFIEKLAEEIGQGLSVRCVATSRNTEQLAKSLGIQVFDNISKIDVDVDGADEIDGNGNMIKGGGGALFREKIVAYNSRKVIIIADSTKLHPEGIGNFGIPVEVNPFLSQNTRYNLERLGGSCKFRDGGNFYTDNGNLILDCHFGIISNPVHMEQSIKMIPGVVEVGIFTNLADTLLLGRDSDVEVVDFSRKQ